MFFPYKNQLLSLFDILYSAFYRYSYELCYENLHGATTAIFYPKKYSVSRIQARMPGIYQENQRKVFQPITTSIRNTAYKHDRPRRQARENAGGKVKNASIWLIKKVARGFQVNCRIRQHKTYAATLKLILISAWSTFEPTCSRPGVCFDLHYSFLKSRAQINFHTVLSFCPIIHQQEVRVIWIKQSPTGAWDLFHSVVGRI